MIRRVLLLAAERMGAATPGPVCGRSAAARRQARHDHSSRSTPSLQGASADRDGRRPRLVLREGPALGPIPRDRIRACRWLAHRGDRHRPDARRWRDDGGRRAEARVVRRSLRHVSSADRQPRGSAGIRRRASLRGGGDDPLRRSCADGASNSRPFRCSRSSCVGCTALPAQPTAARAGSACATRGRRENEDRCRWSAASRLRIAASSMPHRTGKSSATSFCCATRKKLPRSVPPKRST